MFLKHRFSKSHVSPKGRFNEFTSLVTQVKLHERTSCVPGLRRNPTRSRARPLRNNAPACARPLSIAQSGRQILQPSWLDPDVVIHEGHNIASGRSNPGIEGIGFTLLRVKKIAEMGGKSVAEIGDDFARRII